MKRHWILLFLCCVCLMAQKAPPLPTIHLWSGRVEALPFVAKKGWKLEGEHGRLIAQQEKAGAVNLAFPALKGKETLILSVDGAPTARITVHPAQMLAGVVADCRCRREELEALGVSHRPSETEGVAVAFLTLDSLESFEKETTAAQKTMVVFTERRDFPLKITDEWSEISMGLDMGKRKAFSDISMGLDKGTFSVVLDRQERIIDFSDGGVVWITARHGPRNKVVLLPPDFDLKDIDNVLFLQKELEK